MTMKDVEFGEWYRISVCFGNSTITELKHVRRSAGWADTQGPIAILLYGFQFSFVECANYRPFKEGFYKISQTKDVIIYFSTVNEIVCGLSEGFKIWQQIVSSNKAFHLATDLALKRFRKITVSLPNTNPRITNQISRCDFSL